MTNASRPYGRALIVASLVLVGACGTDDAADSVSDSSTSTTVAGVVTGSETSTVTSEPDPTTSPSTTSANSTTSTTSSTTTTTEPERGGADCLPGRWVLRSQEFFDDLFVALGPEAAEVTSWTHTGGEYVSTIGADGSFLSERLAWQFRLATAEGAIVTTIDSSDLGTYSVDGDQITINDPGGEATIRFQLDVGGQLQDFPVAPQQTVGTDAISGTGPFSCEGDVLRASVKPAEESFTIEAVWDRS